MKNDVAVIYAYDDINNDKIGKRRKLNHRFPPFCLYREMKSVLRCVA